MDCSKFLLLTLSSRTPLLLLSLATAILVWWLWTTKGRWSLEFLYGAELVHCWVMTHSLGLVRIPVPDNGLGRQSPSYASDLASSHNGLDNGSLPCRRETGEEDHGLDKFWELGLIGGQI